VWSRRLTASTGLRSLDVSQGFVELKYQCANGAYELRHKKDLKHVISSNPTDLVLYSSNIYARI
jgi:hypothetical protein